MYYKEKTLWNYICKKKASTTTVLVLQGYQENDKMLSKCFQSVIQIEKLSVLCRDYWAEIQCNSLMDKNYTYEYSSMQFVALLQQCLIRKKSCYLLQGSQGFSSLQDESTTELWLSGCKGRWVEAHSSLNLYHQFLWLAKIK